MTDPETRGGVERVVRAAREFVAAQQTLEDERPEFSTETFGRMKQSFAALQDALAALSPRPVEGATAGAATAVDPREEWIRDNAVSLLAERDAIERQRKRLAQVQQSNEELMRQRDHANSAADRVTWLLGEIVALSAGWDEDGSTGPRPPLTWESVGMIAMDYARAALKDLSPAPERSEAPFGRCEACGADVDSRHLVIGHTRNEYVEGQPVPLSCGPVRLSPPPLAEEAVAIHRRYCVSVACRDGLVACDEAAALGSLRAAP